MVLSECRVVAAVSSFVGGIALVFDLLTLVPSKDGDFEEAGLDIT